MKKIYSLIFGVMLATNASAQFAHFDWGDWPDVATPEGYRLDSTYTECWHPLHNQGKHEPDRREEYRYDSQGRKTLYLQFSFSRYIQDEYGVWYSDLLEEPDLWEQVRYHYTDKGEQDRATRRTYDVYSYTWIEDYSIYSDFDEVTGLPRYFWYGSGKYEDGDENYLPDYRREIVKYHDRIPETVYFHGLDSVGEPAIIGILQREFNDWGGIASERREQYGEWGYINTTVYQYDDHHNLTAVKDTTWMQNGEVSTATPKYVNEYDENGLLKSVLERPYSTIGMFTQTFYYWSKIEDPSGITALPVKEEKADVWYDLSGCRLAGQPTQPGIYIRGGKKIMVN